MALLLRDGRSFLDLEVLEVGGEPLTLPLVVEAVHHRDVVARAREDDRGAADEKRRPEPNPEERHHREPEREKKIVAAMITAERFVARLEVASVVAIFALSIHG